MRDLPWWFWVAGVLLVLWAGFHAVLYGIRWSGEADLDRLHADIQAAGSPVTLDDWIATLPPAHPAANRALRDAAMGFVSVPILDGDKTIDAWLYSASAAPLVVDRLVAMTSASRARLRASLQDPEARWGIAWTLPRSATAALPELPDVPKLLACRQAATSLLAAWRRTGDPEDLWACWEFSQRLGTDSIIEAMIRIGVESQVQRAMLAATRQGATPPAVRLTGTAPSWTELVVWRRTLQGERMTTLAMLVASGVATRHARAPAWPGREPSHAFLPKDMAFWQQALFHRENDPHAPEIPFPTGRWAALAVSAIVLPNTLETWVTMAGHDASQRAAAALIETLPLLPPGSDATAAIAAIMTRRDLLDPGPDRWRLRLRALGPRSLRIAVDPDQPFPDGLHERMRDGWNGRPRPSRHPQPPIRTGGTGGSGFDLDLP
ncbi:MAG: hypothetical protein RLZZ127_3130 [Planctomycetota bacterium]|jgi:hypothetical protein